MMNLIRKISIIALLLLCNNLYGQETEFGSITEKHKISSQDEGEYILKITFPKKYSADKEYKTLYYLDAYWLSEITLGSYTILNLSNSVEDVVFVGISLDGSEKDWHKQRNMDFTPSPFKNFGILEDRKKLNPENKIKVRFKTGSGDFLSEENTGGANLFLDFIENDVIQFVENKYPNLNKRRGLIGHSLGGLFGFYTLQNRPELFKDLILISPSLSWNSFELVDKSKFSKLTESKSNIKLYHSYGESEITAIKKSSNNIKSILVESKIENLNYKFNPFKDSNHHSVLPKAIYDGLFFLYKK